MGIAGMLRLPAVDGKLDGAGKGTMLLLFSAAWCPAGPCNTTRISST